MQTYGSEFINRTVAQLLERLLPEFTKSRAYRITDNALVEGRERYGRSVDWILMGEGR